MRSLLELAIVAMACMIACGCAPPRESAPAQEAPPQSRRDREREREEAELDSTRCVDEARCPASCPKGYLCVREHRCDGRGRPIPYTQCFYVLERSR